MAINQNDKFKTQVRFNPELASFVKKLAEKEQRSFNQMVNLIIERYKTKSA